MDVRLPDGTVIQGVPDGTTRAQLAGKLKANGYDVPADWGAEAPEPRKLGARDYLGMVARPAIQAINAPGELIGDALGFADRKVAEGLSKLTGYQLPPATPRTSEIDRQSLDATFAPPPTKGGRIAETMASMVMGAGLPGPKMTSKVPDNFGSQAMRQTAMQEASKAGYVAPPSSIAPTFGNRLLEGLSGKLKLGQVAQERNQGVTDALSALALGERSGAALTPGAIQAIRSEASRTGYGPLRNMGVIATDDAYQKALDAITAGAKGAEKSFPGIRAASPIDDVVKSLRQEKFDSADGLDAIQHLRTQANDAYSAGQKELGKQYKSAAKAIEDAMERSLVALGKDGAGQLSAFRKARELIAKTYTANKAAVGDAGQFNASKYASEMSKGVPLTGEQRTIANFAQSFGRYVKKPNGDTVPNVSPVDAYASAIASGVSGSPLPFMYPLTRAGLREYLLSPAAQKRAMQAKPWSPPQWNIPGAIAPAQGLFAE